MKKVLFTLVIIMFFIAALSASAFGISSFFITQTQTYDMQEISVDITERDEWTGRNPSLTLYTKDKDTIYEISSVWYNKFDADAFNNNFVKGKEYRLIVNNENINDFDVIYIYGIADEQQEYLSSKNAISAEKSNSVLGLVAGLALLCGIVTLIVVIFINIKSVAAFLKEFYS